ncbi:MAG: DUF177 domain-containing protein [Lachnospiraceae bacterium]|nr:DUF177 domain-containing protein [Lachnospiraceae bacterium]
MCIPLEHLFSKENNQEKHVILNDNKTILLPMGEFPVIEISPIHLELTHTGRRKLLVDGSVELIALQVPCDRCLKEVRVAFSVHFHKEIDCSNLESEDSSDDTQYIVDSCLDLDKIIQDEILLQWPAKVLCRESCKGICKICGHDLNAGDCGCDRVVLDPRMAAIQDIFNQGAN